VAFREKIQKEARRQKRLNIIMFVVSGIFLLLIITAVK
jgi:predicted nucleic acid-binding Zn ribbon protein